MLFWLGVFVSSALCEHSAHVQVRHYRMRTYIVHWDFPFLSRHPRARGVYMCWHDSCLLPIVSFVGSSTGISMHHKQVVTCCCCTAA